MDGLARRSDDSILFRHFDSVEVSRVPKAMYSQNLCDKPLVSIIIPVFNGSRFMKEAIDSALNQAYSNCEVIVVNDGSTDDGRTAGIARSYGTRIRYLEKLNGGCGSALNVGIANMRGDYFSWLSHDDVYERLKVASQMSALLRAGKPDAIVYSGYKLIDSKSKRLGKVLPERVLGRHRVEEPLLPLLRGLIHGCSLLIPRMYFDAFGSFDESLVFTQDYDLWFKFLRTAPLVYDPKPYVKSRVHPDQDTQSRNDGHNQEANSLWGGILRAVTEDEMTRLDGSRCAFFLNMESFLSRTGYVEARKRATAMASVAVSEIIVSIVMPVRESWALVKEAMESVKSQTHTNWELIIVDDGSLSRLKEFVKACDEDPRIVYVKQENEGPGSARNRGIRVAVGKYIAFLGAGDMFEPEKLDRQVRLMEASGYDVSHTSYRRVVAGGHQSQVVRSGIQRGAIFPEVITNCMVATPTTMVKRSALSNVVFPCGMSVGEDICLWIKLSEKYRWGAIDEPLTRVREEARSPAIARQEQIISLLNISCFCMQDPKLAGHVKEVGRLLRLAKYLNGMRPEPQAVKLARAERKRERLMWRSVAREVKRLKKRVAGWAIRSMRG